MELKINKKSVRKFLILLVSVPVFVFGIMISYNSLGIAEQIRQYLLLSVIYILICYIITKNTKLSIKKIDFLFLFFCFWISILSIVHSEAEFFYAAILLYTSYIIARKTWNITTYYRIIIIAFILSYIIIISMYSISPYNSQGLITAFAGIMLMNYLCLNKSKFPIYVLSVLLILLLLSITRSRTSILGFLIIALITFFYLYVSKLTIKKILIIITISLIIVMFAETIGNYFVQTFFGKWQNSDISSSRYAIWGYIIENISVTGHGSNHLAGWESIVGIQMTDTHNSFMEVLGRYGILSFVTMIMITIQIVKRIINLNYPIIYVNFFSGWFVMSMFENLELISSRFIPVTMLFFVHVSLLFSELEKKDTI